MGRIEMKKEKKLFVITLVIAFVTIFAVVSANAAWIGTCTIVNVSVEQNGDYAVRAGDGTTTYTFTIPASAANANAMLALALTAASAGDTVNVQYATGGVMERIWLVK
jgi:hypothetical protein